MIFNCDDTGRTRINKRLITHCELAVFCSATRTCVFVEISEAPYEMMLSGKKEELLNW